MRKTYIVYIMWLLGVILWDFLYPQANPIYDVIMAVLLSGMVIVLNKKNYFNPISFNLSSK